MIFISLILFPCLRLLKKKSLRDCCLRSCVSAVEGLSLGSLFRPTCRMYTKVVVQTVQSVLSLSVEIIRLQRQRTQVNKLTKKYFFFFVCFSVCTRSHCDSSHVLKNVAIPGAPVLMCSACGLHHLDMP